MLTETDLDLAGGRTLHVYDTGGVGVPVVWHHGTPNTGEPPAPLFDAADRLGLRWVSYDRPNYGPSTPLPGRDLASAAADTTMVADALGLGRFAVMGHSGGSNHALACAALLTDRVLACVCMAALAPFGAEGLDWFAGMAAGGVADLTAAATGRTALEQHLERSDFDPEQFTPADHEAISGDWAWLGGVAGQAVRGGTGGMVDDDLAYVAPWGYVPEQVVAPVLLVHGEQDRMVPSSHGRWLAGRVTNAQLWLRPDDGHISVLHSAEDALAWLATRVIP
jgi:pimeloyl-ACP methyl ester carboxylesterase